MKPTAGPWHYQELSDAYTHIVRGPNNELVLYAPQATDGQSEANARLGAAAPELLAALEDLIAAVPKQTDDADWWPDELTHAVRAAREAIAKAEAQ